MFNIIRDKFGAKFLAHGKKGAGAQRIAVAEGVTLVTSNPDTYTRFSGNKVKDFKAKARREQRTARPVNAVPA